MTMSSRVAARASSAPVQVKHPRIPRNEMAILRAKAEVCDAYRDWLANPRNKERKPLVKALERLRQLELEMAP